MKELSIEEKARAYDKALARAKEQLNGAKVFDYDNEQVAHDIRTTVYNILPELKESEDERIRKQIISFLKGFECDHYRCLDFSSWIVWLEKQGEQSPDEWHIEDEQNLNACLGYIPDEFLKRWLKDVIHAKYDKPINKLEAKFHEGDWIVYNRNDHSRKIMQIYDIRDNRYYFNDNIHFSWSVKECDEKSHLWTIKDAKDGDVLDANGAPFIYKKHDKDCVYFYCGVNLAGEFIEANGIDTWNNNYKVYPATKEQYDLLFQKMKEVGYEWNKDKKELIKL